MGPPFLFFISQRRLHKKAGDAERRSVIITNIAIAIMVTTACFLIGPKTYFMIQIPTMGLAGCIGVWMFYVQHQYEGVYWARHDEWDPIKAALEGSSYYKLPKIFQWFSGNIGLHHIHHLRSRIPNYYLQQCIDEVPELQVKPLTFITSLKSMFMNLLDEESMRMVSFKVLKSRQVKLTSSSTV